MTVSAERRVDPITLEVIRQGFIAAADEMKINLTRTSYNPIIYEVLDFSVGLFDSRGNIVSQAAGLPFFLGNLGEAVRVVIADVGIESLEPGDVYLINDTYAVGTHLNDVTAITPVYTDDNRLVGFTASRAHWLDVGARDPGGWLSDTTEIYQEGIRLRSVRLYEAGRVSDSIMRILRDNVRYADSVLGDLRAQLAAGRTGEQRFRAILSRWGVETVELAIEEILRQGERATREAISRMKDGIYRAQAHLDDDGVAVEKPPVCVTVTIAGEEMTIDLEGSAPQNVGPMNCGLPSAISACRVALKCIAAPFDPVNEGSFAPLTVLVPDNCMYNAKEPTPAGVYGLPMITLCDTIWRALSDALPEAIPAGHFADLGTLFIWGTDPETGKPYIHAEPQGGGWGAGPHGDGENMLICIADGDTRNVPVEVIESKYPLRVERYALRNNSGGPGEHRGGLGQYRDYRILDDSARMTTTNERTTCPPWGLRGGLDGATGEVVINPGSDSETHVRKASALKLANGDLVSSRTGGGGGWGDPEARDRAAVARDVLDGYISEEAARPEYGSGPSAADASMDELARELADFLRIPSVSADSSFSADVSAACDWVCERVRLAGGSAEFVETRRHPLAIGFIPASVADAPTVMLYGHFDVQPPGDTDLWLSPPFDPQVRDGWLYARGASDDKGNLYMLLKAAEALAKGGKLAANVRVVCDGEEEIGGLSVCEFVEHDAVRPVACLIFDGPRLRSDQPVFCTATRGLVYLHLRVETSASDLHSGTYGGVAANAVHALAYILATVAPPDETIHPDLTAGAEEPNAEELSRWAALEAPGARLARERVRPVSRDAVRDFYPRTWARPSVDVNGMSGGEAVLVKTIIPAVAEANVSIRLAPGQRARQVAEAFERLLQEVVPEGASLECTLMAATDPGRTDPSLPVIKAAADAFERATGTPPIFVREGGTLPVFAALGERGIPTIMTGFTLPEDNIHAPNERFRLEHLPVGISAACEMINAIAQAADRTDAAIRVQQ